MTPQIILSSNKSRQDAIAALQKTHSFGFSKDGALSAPHIAVRKSSVTRWPIGWSVVAGLAGK
jgi:hypothetical protein